MWMMKVFTVFYLQVRVWPKQCLRGLVCAGPADQEGEPVWCLYCGQKTPGPAPGHDAAFGKSGAIFMIFLFAGGSNSEQIVSNCLTH